MDKGTLKISLWRPSHLAYITLTIANEEGQRECSYRYPITSSEARAWGRWVTQIKELPGTYLVIMGEGWILVSTLTNIRTMPHADYGSYDPQRHAIYGPDQHLIQSSTRNSYSHKA